MGRRALVIGGSLGGLFAAAFLRSIGWDAVVFERSRGDLSGRGAGLGTRGELFAALERLGIALDESMRTEVRSRVCLGAEGDVICEVPVRTVTTAWDRIYRVLRQALPDRCYRGGMQLASLAHRPDGVRALFADGSQADGDLLVGADGIRSTVRGALLPGVEPTYAGYVAWRFVLTEAEVAPEFRDLVFHHMNFCFPDGELALTVPMCRADDDRHSPRRCQVSWFRPAEPGAVVRALCTDSAGHCHGASIPPSLIRKELIEEVKAAARSVLPPQFSALIARARHPILQPIFDLEVSRLTFGRALLLGDAGFVARPHVGTGVTKAAVDARCLADAIVASDGDLDAAQARYDRERSRFGRSLVARGRRLGAYLSAQGKPREQRARRELCREPGAVMRAFGAAEGIEGASAADR